MNYRRERTSGGIIELPQAGLTEQYYSLTGARCWAKTLDVDGPQKQLNQLESPGLTCYSHIVLYIWNS